jgi:hypothetical protein
VVQVDQLLLIIVYGFCCLGFGFVLGKRWR